jgi:CRP/FNR family transcriptional regulator, cyclic AMP receptor protein
MAAADPDPVDVLRSTDLFSSLSRRTLKKVAAQVQATHHPAGKQITEEGGGGVGFHLITAGRATVSAGGQARATLGPGDYFGEIALIDGLPRSATVTADEDVTTLFLASWVFKPLLNEEPELAVALLQVMCARLRAAETA